MYPLRPSNRHQPKKRLITIRRGEGGRAARGGPLWTLSREQCGPPCLHMSPDCLIGPDAVADAGGHKGPHPALHHPRPYGMIPALSCSILPSLDTYWATLVGARLTTYCNSCTIASAGLHQYHVPDMAVVYEPLPTPLVLKPVARRDEPPVLQSGNRRARRE
jgi:hypothetical protein